MSQGPGNPSVTGKFCLKQLVFVQKIILLKVPQIWGS